MTLDQQIEEARDAVRRAEQEHRYCLIQLHEIERDMPLAEQDVAEAKARLAELEARTTK
jgi:chromosome segregation ATPase